MFPEGRILEIIIVFAVALIVVGPKDLPILMRKVGEFLARMRSMAAEFRASFDELARQSELDELRKEVEAMRAQRPFDAAAAAFGAKDATVSNVFDEIDKTLAEGGAQMHPPMAYQTPPTFDEGIASAAEPIVQDARPARKPRAKAGPKIDAAGHAAPRKRAKPKADAPS